MANSRFIGIQYPVVSTTQGLFAPQDGVQQIKSDLLQLLLTYPGERVFLPTFGTPLRDLLFDPNDPTLAAQATQMISNAILAWEPRIVVTDISVTPYIDPSELNPLDDKTEMGAILSIKISFVDPQNITAIQNLALQVPLGA